MSKLLVALALAMVGIRVLSAISFMAFYAYMSSYFQKQLKPYFHDHPVEGTNAEETAHNIFVFLVISAVTCALAFLDALVDGLKVCLGIGNSSDKSRGSCGQWLFQTLLFLFAIASEIYAVVWAVSWIRLFDERDLPYHKAHCQALVFAFGILLGITALVCTCACILGAMGAVVMVRGSSADRNARSNTVQGNDANTDPAYEEIAL